MSAADIKLSESTLNIIENLAWRIAENHGGPITAITIWRHKERPDE